MVPGTRVNVVPLATVTLPARTTSPDHVVLVETVLSAAEAKGRSETIRRSETKP